MLAPAVLLFLRRSRSDSSSSGCDEESHAQPSSSLVRALFEAVTTGGGGEAGETAVRSVISIVRRRREPTERSKRSTQTQIQDTANPANHVTNKNPPFPPIYFHSGIGPVDARSYRIVKSLYDAREERNLRDDIRVRFRFSVHVYIKDLYIYII